MQIGAKSSKMHEYFAGMQAVFGRIYKDLINFAPPQKETPDIAAALDRTYTYYELDYIGRRWTMRSRVLLLPRAGQGRVRL